MKSVKRVHPILSCSFPLQHEQLEPRQHVTTFRTHFQPPGADFTPTKPIIPPLSAFITNSNSYSKLNTSDVYQSTTQQAYKLPQCSQKSKIQLGNCSIQCTNFKMDADHRINTFSTSNQLEYSAKSITTPSREYEFSVLRRSDPGPLGNKIIIPDKRSEYIDSFRHSTQYVRRKTERPSCVPRKDPIKGCLEDLETNDFTTTTMDTFRGVPKQEDNSLSHTARLQQTRITSIPFGDSIKERVTSTNHQDSYRFRPLVDKAVYNKKTAHNTIHNCSVRLGGTKNIPVPTKIHFPFHSNPDICLPIVHERNTSSLPVGDLNAERVKERLSLLTSRTMHPKLPLNSFPVHIDSSRLHTHSNIHLGHSPMISCPQSTFTDSYKSITSRVEHIHAPAEDNITFGYKSGEILSTAQDSYQPKLHNLIEKPNPITMENLKKSHWQLPNMGVATFSTTHQRHFGPRQKLVNSY